MSAEEFRRYLAENQGKAKVPKYRNQKIETEDGVFDSKKEFRRWCELKLMAKAGRITDLDRQVNFTFEVNGATLRYAGSGRSVTFRPDFVYKEAGSMIVEDVKSEATITRVYLIKKALMKACYGIEVEEV